MIELHYRYCDLDKIHYYSIVNSENTSLLWLLWLWHYTKFRHTKNVALTAYSDNADKILARYKGINAKITAGHISRKIEKHRKGLKI